MRPDFRSWLSGRLHDWLHGVSPALAYRAWRWGHGGPCPHDRGQW